MLKVLQYLIGKKRPHGSASDGSTIPYLLSILPSGKKWVDGAGNLHVDMRTTKKHRTLFVAHIDTVHRIEGTNNYREDSKGFHAIDAPLGADDAAGVSILCSLIGNVPAYYIFTRGEECGGIGSKYLAEQHSALLGQFDRAIAFDRKGTSDVISHQAVGRCCSDRFAEALSEALNNEGLLYCPSDAGVYTDTAEYVSIIPECTNISVGYYSEHTPKEWLDIDHWQNLLAAALRIQWDKLPTDRDPADIEIDFPPCIDERDFIIRDAVFSAIDGKPRELIRLVGKEIYPEDPRFGERFTDPKAFHPDDVYDMCMSSFDWQMILETITENAKS